jgi:protoporphyrinogen/coproporphyrinogen III oxidase
VQFREGAEPLRSVAVIGGGIAGLSAAFRLSQRTPRLEVAVYEKEPQVGGIVRTHREDGRLVELGPNGFLDSKPEIMALCHELGLELEKADPKSAERFVEIDGRLRRLPKTPGEFLRSDILSFRGKLRFLSERFFGKASTLLDESIADFGRRHFGGEATNNLIDAVVTGIYAGDIEKLSVRSCFPKLVELEAKYGSLLKAQGAMAKEKRQRGEAPGLGTLNCPVGGMGTLIHRFAERLGSIIQTNKPARSVTRESDGWRIAVESENKKTDVVIFATPARITAQLIDDVALRSELASIPDAPAVVVGLSFKQSLPTGFGFIIPERLGREVLGVIYSSNIFPSQSPNGEAAVRAILGGERRRDVLDWNDAQLIQSVRNELERLLDIDAAPTFAFVQRWPHAIPQYYVGHEARLKRIEESLTRLPGLFLCGASYRGVAIADCVRDGFAVAEQAVHYLERQ